MSGETRLVPVATRNGDIGYADKLLSASRRANTRPSVKGATVLDLGIEQMTVLRSSGEPRRLGRSRSFRIMVTIGWLVMMGMVGLWAAAGVDWLK